MVDYINSRVLRPVIKVLAVAGAAASLFTGGVLIGRVNADQAPVTQTSHDMECERGDDALAATAAAHLAVLVSQRVAGSQAVRDASGRLGARPEVAEEFGRWAEQENPAYRHGLFGATAVKVDTREGDRARVAVDGYWLRSGSTAVGAGEVTSALWTYWLVWRDGRWTPSSPPEATTLPEGAVHKSLAFLRISSGFVGVPYVRC
ncbi:hypothetical protein [Actinosynnema sp. NPDC023587]|uniref:hypothetical protein n=1 Tax=Actinosynnema sp. NPDC023587 TaxID=3154695 RepID=UPI0033E5666C